MQNFAPLESQIKRSESDVFPHSRTKELIIRVLKHEPDALTDLPECGPSYRNAVDGHGSGLRIGRQTFGQQAVQMHQQRCLARATGSDQCHGLA